MDFWQHACFDIFDVLSEPSGRGGNPFK